MKIYYAQPSKEVEEVIERIKSLSLAYEIQVQSDLAEISIEDGGEHYVGKQQILKHLEQVEGELGEWYYCGC